MGAMPGVRPLPLGSSASKLSGRLPAVRPQYRHLMAKAPRLEPLNQVSEFNRGSAYFALVVREAPRLVIGDRILLFPHVSEHAQQSFALQRAAFAKAAVLLRHEQGCKQMAVLPDEMMREIAVRHSLQLPQQVRRQTTANESLAQFLQFLESDPLQKSRL